MEYKIEVYYNLYAQKNTLPLADAFESSRNKYLKLYGLDPVYFFSAPELAWMACLKKKKAELELLTDADVQLIKEKGIAGGIYYAIHIHAKANNKYMKHHDPRIESSYLMYLDINNSYGQVMQQKLPVNDFRWRNNQ